MKRVLICDRLAPEGRAVLEGTEGIEVEERLKLSEEELCEAVAGVSAVIVRSATQITARVLEAATDLEVVGRAGVGVDNIDCACATKRGVLVMNTPGGSAITTAEHAISLLCSLSRNIPQATASMKTGKWEKSRFMGRELTGKTLGIIGVGNIGRVVADRARGLRMKVLVHDPFLSAEAAGRLEVKLCSLDELFATADYISVHAPLTADTRSLLDHKAFAKMKRGVMIVNCARGGIVNEGDLAEALREGIVGGAALDVFSEEPLGESPLLGLDNFICTPHLGASTDEAQVAVSVAVAEQIAEFLTQGVLRNSVNFPAISRELLDALGPFLTLAERVGAFVGQVREATVERVYAKYDGSISSHDLSSLTSAFLKGLLSPMFDAAGVNYVNARVLANEHGIEVIESKSARAKDYTSLITLRVVGGGYEMTVAGTLFGRNDPRIVRVDQFRLEVLPEGHAILLHNLDRPGVIGAIGSLLGERGINISRMQLGLDRDKEEALSVWSTSAPVGPEVLGAIRDLPNTLSVKPLFLG